MAKLQSIRQKQLTKYAWLKPLLRLNSILNHKNTSSNQSYYILYYNVVKLFYVFWTFQVIIKL